MNVFNYDADEERRRDVCVVGARPWLERKRPPHTLGRQGDEADVVVLLVVGPDTAGLRRNVEGRGVGSCCAWS